MIPSELYSELFMFSCWPLLCTCSFKVISPSLNPQKIDSFNHLWKEIASLHVTVPLSMFCLYAGNLNDDLCDRSERLKDKIITFQVEENRDLNKG